MRSRIVALALIICAFNVQAQELEKAPKQISFELGYRYIMTNELISNGGLNGYGFLIDYAWQLSGFTETKHPVYLSVPLGYTIIPGSETLAGQRMLHYGWAVRHMLGKKKTIQPYVGYGLLLNQISIEDREGQVFGHQTRFGFGMNYNNKSILTPYLTLEYSMARHPQLDVEESSWIHFLEVKAGVRFK
jgi:hypothetical protein